MTKPIATDREILGLKPEAKAYERTISGTAGLRIRVLKSGAKVFELRYVALNGTRRRFQLGQYPAMGLSDARMKAGKVRNRRADGADPAAERADARDAARNGETLCELAEANFKAKAIGLHGGKKRPLKPATIATERKLFKHHVAPMLGSRNFAEIRRKDVKQFMGDLAADSGLSPASVAAVGAVLQSVFQFAIHQEWLESNPVGSGNQSLARPIALGNGRERLFGDDSLSKLWNVLCLHSVRHARGDSHDDEISRLAPQTCLAARLALVTLARRGEVCGARWDEIDRKTRIWVLPAVRTKAGRTEVKPLSQAALDILDAAAQLDDASPTFCFPAPGASERSLNPMRLTRAIARLCFRLGIPHGSPHDIRRSGASTLTGEKYGFPRFIVGLVLGHEHSRRSAG
jgi:integrase